MTQMGLYMFCAGDTGRYFSNLEPNFRSQIQSLKQSGAVHAHNFVYSFDSAREASFRCRLNPAPYRDSFFPVDEINTGDPREVADFFAWSCGRFPSHANVFVLGGHGVAWDYDVIEQSYGRRALLSAQESGIVLRRALFRSGAEEGLCATVQSTGALLENVVDVRAVLPDMQSLDYLSDLELTELVDNLRGNYGVGIPDVFVFDACSMSSIEILTAMAGYPRWIVASFDEEPSQGIPFAKVMDALVKSDAYVTEEPGEAIAYALVDAFADAYGGGSPARSGFGTQHFSLIALRADRKTVRAVVASVKKFVDTAIDELSGSAEALKEIRTSTRSLPRLFNMQYIADMRSLLEKMAALGGSVATAADALKADIFETHKVVGHRYVGDAYADIGGLSCFWPKNKDDFRQHSAVYRDLAFAKQTGWFDLCELVFG